MSKRIGWVLLLVGLCLMLPGCILLTQVTDGYQYVVPAGNLAETYPQAMTAAAGLADIGSTASVSARKQGVILPGSMEEVGVTLYGVDAAYPEVRHETLQAGRFISAGDVEKARPVIVIDEATAYVLFTGGDALGRTVTIEGFDWQIVGIVADTPRFGEADAGVAYIPITTAVQLDLSMDTLEICAVGTSQSVLVEATLKQWRSDGSFHDLAREKYAAAMPLRWAVTIAAWMLTLWLFRKTLCFCKGIWNESGQRLQSHYLLEIAPWLSARMALLLLLSMAAAGTTITAMKLLTAPALVFTDWIPDNPVSLAAYVTRFWAIHRENAKAIQYLTSEKSATYLAAWLIRWGMLAVLGGAFLTKQNGRKST